MTRSVLIVDDSAVARQVLAELFAADSGLRVLGTAASPFQAVEIMRREAPDVIVLDIDMPGMDGLTFLQRIMEQHPMPVVICSNLIGRDEAATRRARELGAVAVFPKPNFTADAESARARAVFVATVRTAGLQSTPRAGAQPSARALHDLSQVVPAGSQPFLPGTAPILVLGASTGGTEALATVLSGLPGDTPGTVIVQHMPKAFTGPFAERLHHLSAMDVHEAVHGERLRRGVALLAPGGYQCLLQRAPGGYQVEIVEAPTVNRHKPSVDVLFASTARIAGANAVAAILTGMGDDGAAGMLELRQAGAHTIAQDEATCVVFGMPREAIRMGGAAAILPLPQIAGALTHAFKKSTST